MKRQGIYIIMYINSGIYLQDLQGGLCVKGESFRGFSGRFTRHKNISNSYRKRQGSYCKTAKSSSSFRPVRTGGGGGLVR
jgi:hypothetical protein